MKINAFQKTMIWITQGLANFPRVKFRYIVAPKGPISSEFLPMGFYSEEISRLIELGKEDAKNTIELGEGVMLNHLTSYWNHNNENPTSNETFELYLNRMVKE